MVRRIVLLIVLIATSFTVFAIEKSVKEENHKADEWKGDVDVTFAGWTEHLTSTGRNQDNYIVGVRYKRWEAFSY